MNDSLRPGDKYGFQAGIYFPLFPVTIYFFCFWERVNSKPARDVRTSTFVDPLSTVDYWAFHGLSSVSSGEFYRYDYIRSISSYTYTMGLSFPPHSDSNQASKKHLEIGLKVRRFIPDRIRYPAPKQAMGEHSLVYPD